MPRDDRRGAPGDDPGRYGARGGCDPGPNGADPELDQDRARAADVVASTLRGAAPGEVPERLCAVAVELLPVNGASVSLRGVGMPARLGASSPRAAHLADVQATLGDGPCRRVLDTGAPVFACDLGGGGDAARWPVFAQAATAAGVRAVYAVPLGFGEVCVGTLDLYRETPGALTDRQLSTAEIVAGAMTAALMVLAHGEEYGAEAPGGQWLGGLAADHGEVHHAVGVIMAQLGTGAEDALARLRGKAFIQGRTVRDVAREVVARRGWFEGD